MRVLVMRPLQDAQETARLLEEMDHSAIVAPLLEMRFFGGPPLSLDGVQAILATSANGVRAIARRIDERAIPVFAVGTQTAEAAKSAGFKSIKNADGDAEALAKATMQWASPKNGALLHASGKDTEGKLEADLTRAGFSVRRETLYEAIAVEQLPAEAAQALKASSLDAVLFFSPRSAKILCDCVSRAGLGQTTRRLVACCISARAAQALTMSFQGVRIAEHPDQAALLRCLAMAQS
ncbi:MAG TPA: uroporphyrinogen-III synthase [Rhizomicrobium sp.]